jgi:hypothetical protein
MKWYSETTAYTDSMPNGTYLLNDSKTKLYAYVSPGSGTPKQFKNPIKIDTRGRKFVESSTQYKIVTKEEPEGRVWEVQGSKGDVYKVTEANGYLSCTCSGFRFRGDCKHVKSIQP